MTAGDVTQGRRNDAEPWNLEPGDYTVSTGDEPAAWVRLPNGVGPSCLKGWALTEHEDRTITVSPSILDGESGWHGFLERGVWREV